MKLLHHFNMHDVHVPSLCILIMIILFFIVLFYYKIERFPLMFRLASRAVYFFFFVLFLLLCFSLSDYDISVFKFKVVFHI